MGKRNSNRVYVVSLANWTPSRRTFSYPKEASWPKEAPNYVAFRTGGKLASIHYIEGAKTKSGRVIIHLGKSFSPKKDLPDGNIWPNGKL